jgi:hypothetical protein
MGFTSINAYIFKRIKLFPRTRITIVAGKPVDLSPWYGKGDDPQALD